KNKNKLKEIKNILKGLNLSLKCLSNMDKKIRIVENGKTFEENAVKKALAVSRHYKKDLIVGEDSGLSVDYLKGAPGVYSKRYAGKSGNQKKNNHKILKALNNIPVNKRKAHFSCILALAKEGKVLAVLEGKLSGRIAFKEEGDSGFGYDPVFYLPGFKKTVAQIPMTTKNRISHRAQAFKKLKQFLHLSSFDALKID
ncbi:MAG: RdgB/HAM1 family non-canonical purine NTP pyrophosphatase, partial [Candidatus Omnitrophica bacterium]|nr:RdgB/HAM1 family non-canonical purine NTP pyrophosphatase [Candidatus Omnitrophota bacterium]